MIQKIAKDYFKNIEDDLLKEGFKAFSRIRKYEIRQKDHRIELYIPPPKTSSGKIQYQCPNSKCNLQFYIEFQSIEKISMTCPYCGKSSEEEQFVSEQNKVNIIEEVCFAFYQDCLEIFKKSFKKRIYQLHLLKLYKTNKIFEEAKELSFGMHKAFLLYFIKPNNEEVPKSSLLLTLRVGTAVETKLLHKIKKLKFEDIKKKFSIGINNYIKNPNYPKKGSQYFSIGINISYKLPSEKVNPVREDLLRNIKCIKCSNEYGIYEIGFFCPICGTYNLKHHFNREKELIEKQLEEAEKKKKEDKEYSYRLFGNAHEDVLTTFETYLKKIFFMVKSTVFQNSFYEKDNNQKRLSFPNNLFKTTLSIIRFSTFFKSSCKKNNNQYYLSFQNINKIKNHYKQIKLNPFRCLTNKEKKELELYIQERHLFGHNLGIVDEKFKNKHYTKERFKENIILINNETILYFLSICQKVIFSISDEIEKRCWIQKKTFNLNLSKEVNLLEDDLEVIELLKKSCYLKEQ